MEIGICSYSFYRLLAAGRQDVFQYVKDCKKLGATQLDPWNAHLPLLLNNDKALTEVADPEKSGKLSSEEKDYLHQIRTAADMLQIPFGNVAVDGAHVYEQDPQKRKNNRAKAYRWLEAAKILYAPQLRIDTGGPEDLPNDVLQIIREGYTDLIARGQSQNTQILFENHWGPTLIPTNVLRILESIPNLGYLFDTHNWKPSLKAEGRRLLHKHATYTHLKPLDWDANGNEIGENLTDVIQQLLTDGYQGPWGIESNPKDGQELEAAKKSIALLKRTIPD